MGRLSEAEGKLLAKRTKPMTAPKETKRSKRATGGVGFGGETGFKSRNEQEKLEDLRVRTLNEDGVVLMPRVLSLSSAASLRASVVKEGASARAAVKANPAASFSRFHVAQVQPTRSFILLPFRDDADECGGAIASAFRELVGGDAPLGRLFHRMCDGDDSVLHDFYALCTNPGSVRQVVHSDTPHQKVPPLFAAFIALQDVTYEMGPTIFLPGTHTQTTQRKLFDDLNTRDSMLAKAKSKYALLKAGDAVLFDMRALHAGSANLVEGGSERFFLCITFRNDQARDCDLGHLPCIRPGYKEKLVLGDVRAELEKAQPFKTIGDGLPPSVP